MESGVWEFPMLSILYHRSAILTRELLRTGKFNVLMYRVMYPEHEEWDRRIKAAKEFAKEFKVALALSQCLWKDKNDPRWATDPSVFMKNTIPRVNKVAPGVIDCIDCRGEVDLQTPLSREVIATIHRIQRWSISVPEVRHERNCPKGMSLSDWGGVDRTPMNRFPLLGRRSVSFEKERSYKDIAGYTCGLGEFAEYCSVFHRDKLLYPNIVDCQVEEFIHAMPKGG
jgi:hypothetical protein